MESRIRKAATRFSQTKPGHFQSLLNTIIDMFMQLDNEAERAHKNELHTWYHQGKVGEPPAPEPSRLGKLAALLESIMGYRAEFQTPDRNQKQSALVFFSSIGVGLRPHQLSSGERQILIFSLLLFRQSEVRAIWLIDEPELHLNEARAIELWERIERNFPNALFVYATHSLNFATRAAVDDIFVLSRGSAPEIIERGRGVPSEVIQSIVGGRVQIRLQERKLVLCEDDAMALLLEDLLDNAEYQAIKLGGASAVKAAVTSDGLYRQLVSGHLPRCGVIDRDEWDRETIGVLETKNIFALPYYETEALLMHPKVMSFYLDVAAGRPINSDECTGLIIKAAKKTLGASLNKLANRIAAQCGGKLKYEINDGRISDIELLPQGDAITVFQERAQILLDAVDKEDVSSVLEFFDSKLMYQQLAAAVSKKLDLRLPNDSSQHFRQIRSYRDYPAVVRAVPELADLARKIVAFYDR